VSSSTTGEWEYWTCETSSVGRFLGLFGENRSVVNLAERPEDAERLFGGRTRLDERVVVETLTRDGWDLYQAEPRNEGERDRQLHFRRRKARFKSDTHLVLGLGYGRRDGRTHVSIPKVEPTPVGKVIVLSNGLRFRFLGVTCLQSDGYDPRLLGARSFPVRGENQVLAVLELERIPDGVREIDLREATFSDGGDSGQSAADVISLSYRCGYYRDDGALASGLRGELVPTYLVSGSDPKTVTTGDTRLPWEIDEPLNCELVLFNGPHCTEFAPPVVRHPFTITPTDQSMKAAREQDQQNSVIGGARSWGSHLGLLMTVLVVGVFVAALAGRASGRWNPAGGAGELRSPPAAVVTATIAPTEATAAPASAAPSPAAKSPGQSEAVSWVEVGNTDGEGVFLRRTPTMADRIVAWPDGTRLDVIGPDVDNEGRRWKRVRDPTGQEGYVPEQYTVPGRPR
jgi:hypothetical protein